MPKKQYQNETTLEPIVKCICPRCYKTHEMRMYWTGHGTPRKFCKSCNHVKAYLGPMPEYEDAVSGFYRMAIRRSASL